jgi:hypothetical protein
METRRQGATLFLAIVVLIATLVIIQLWLVAAAVEALLAHEATILWPAAIASIVLFAVNGGLLLYVLAFDRRLRRTGSHD